MTDPFVLVAEALGCPVDSLSRDSAYMQHPAWDSLGHLAVLVSLEEEFGLDLNDETALRYVSMQSILELYALTANGAARRASA
jgi:acyl carrier protein